MNERVITSGFANIPRGVTTDDDGSAAAPGLPAEAEGRRRPHLSQNPMWM